MNKNTKIIPTNFALDEDIFYEKLEKLKFSEIIHLDFMDGTFTEKKTISIDKMNKINEMNNKFEIHLMTKNPEKYLDIIKNLNIFKVLIHIESYLNNFQKLEKIIKKFKVEKIIVFLVLNPKTNIDNLKKIIAKIDGVMLMSVIPGREGQIFIRNTYNKIKALRKLNKEIKIQIDGGINDLNIKRIVQLGAQILSVGSYITSSKNPQIRYNKLKNIINS